MPIPAPPGKKSTAVAGSGAAAVKASATASTKVDTGLSDTYRTPTDDANAKKAEISAVRNELEDFEARLESGAGAVHSNHHAGGSNSNKPITASVPLRQAKAPIGAAAGGGFPISGAAVTAANMNNIINSNNKKKASLTEEEVEAQKKRQSDISDVRNLPSESDDDDE